MYQFTSITTTSSDVLFLLRKFPQSRDYCACNRIRGGACNLVTSCSSILFRISVKIRRTNVRELYLGFWNPGWLIQGICENSRIAQQYGTEGFKRGQRHGPLSPPIKTVNLVLCHQLTKHIFHLTASFLSTFNCTFFVII